MSRLRAGLLPSCDGYFRVPANVSGVPRKHLGNFARKHLASKFGMREKGMIVYLILAICLLLLLFRMLLRAAWRFDQPRIIDAYPTAADALELLIADIESARKDVLVICDESKLDSAMREYQ